MDPRQLDTLRRRLHNRWPLIGGWLRRRAARALASDGSPEALHLLAQTLAEHTDESVRTVARDALACRDDLASVNALADVWTTTRHPDLIYLLGQRGILPSEPPAARVLVALKLGRTAVAAGANAAGGRVLINAIADRDSFIAEQAVAALGGLTDPQAVQVLCDEWASSRKPELEKAVVAGFHVAPQGRARLLSALRVSRLECVRDLEPDLAPALLAALQDPDPGIAMKAATLVEQLSRAETLASLAVPVCERWAASRSPVLERLVVRCKFVAGQPTELRVLTSLKSAEVDDLLEGGSEVVAPLVQACKDPDKQIVAAARSALRGLRRPEARQELCQLFLRSDDVEARDAARDRGWAPDDPAQRALFYFLSEQWERYDTFDFDRRLLFAVHEVADAPLKARIVERLRASGRPDFLTVLAGSDFRARVGRMGADEAEFLVGMLTQHREWDKLWGLAFELPLRQSVQIVRQLARQGWQPGRGSSGEAVREDERSTFARLAQLASDALTAALERHRAPPPAVQRARARVPGRVNDVAFSPTGPVIAIGTGKGKVVLWNYQTASIEETLRVSSHAIGRVAYTPDGTLMATERGQNIDNPPLHSWREGRHSSRKYGSSVTALEPVAGPRMLVCFRDNRVGVFDAEEGILVQEQSYRFWCRGARVSPDGMRAALLHQGITLASLPDLSALAKTPDDDFNRVVSSAAFTGDGSTLVVGRKDGELRVCLHQGEELRPGSAWEAHPREVRGVEMLRDHTVVLSASTDGLLRFTNRADGTRIGEMRVPLDADKRVTSLHVTPGGEFMVLGDSDESMSLWDLRVLGLPELLARPLARSLPVHLAAINSLADAADLPEGLGAVLRYARVVLQHRFRYDIEVDEMTTIRAGEFDIEIEG